MKFAGRRVARTPLTVVMPADGDRAMATFDPGEEVTAAELLAVDPRAVVLSLPRLALAPPDARIYAGVGDIAAGRCPAARCRTSAACARCSSTSARRTC